METTIEVATDDAPVLLAMPVFMPLRPDDAAATLEIEHYLVIQVAGKPAKEFAEGLGFDEVLVKVDNDQKLFGRMIAKVALSFAVLRLGVHRLAECFVADAIRGEADDLGRWIGCGDGEPTCTTEGLHGLRLGIDAQGVVHVFVRLFAEFHMPEYHVLVGRLPPPHGSSI